MQIFHHHRNRISPKAQPSPRFITTSHQAGSAPAPGDSNGLSSNTHPKRRENQQTKERSGEADLVNPLSNGYTCTRFTSSPNPMSKDVLMNMLNDTIIKRKCKRVDLMNKDDKADRISQLPESIVHHILSFLSTQDAVCTSILSKAWHRMWCNFPILDFHLCDSKYCVKHGIEDWDAETAKDEFLNFVDKSLKHRLMHNFNIYKFRMSIIFGDLKQLNPWMDRWLDTIIERKVKELDLNVRSLTGIYSVPSAVVLGAKSITVLRLSDCKLELSSNVIMKCSQLRELCLKNVRVDEQMIQSFTSSCPLIEYLELNSCRGLDSLCLLSTLRQLKKVVLRTCHELKMVQIEAPNLIAFKFSEDSSVPCNINLTACKTLKELSLDRIGMTEESFQNLMFVTPNVEVLELSCCRGLASVKISSKRLKRLVLITCTFQSVAKINTPNLLSVKHFSEDDYHKSLSFNYINTSHLQEVDLELGLASHDIDWFTKLKEFLTSFPCSENFRVVVLCPKNVTVHEKLSELLLPSLYNNLKDLKPIIIISSKTFIELVDRIFGRCHPDTLSLIATCSCRKHLEILYESLVDLEDNRNHRRVRRRNWRHFLGGFKIEDLESTEEKMTSSWKAFLKSYSDISYHGVTLKLEWKCAILTSFDGLPVMF